MSFVHRWFCSLVDDHIAFKFFRISCRRRSLAFLGGVVLIQCVTNPLFAWRDSGYGGPHHDEVISMMASNALEGEFSRLKQGLNYPFNSIVSAKEWHRFTTSRYAISFQEIKRDILANDIHPPLYFYLLNRWLRIFPRGSYHEAVWLSSILIQLAGLLLAISVYRATGSYRLALIALAVFLVGNSAVFTAVWVRQHALFACFYAALIFCSREICCPQVSNRNRIIVGILIGMLSLAGMLTQYTFLISSLPIHLSMLWALKCKGGWRAFGLQSAIYSIAVSAFLLISPGSLRQASAVSQSYSRLPQWESAFSGLPEMFVPLPGSLSIHRRAIFGGLVFIFLLIGVGNVCLRDLRAGGSSRFLSIPLAGFIGSACIQVIFVGLGYFPAHATGPNHLSALWLLIVFAGIVSLQAVVESKQNLIGCGFFLFLVLVQAVFAWHTNRVLPRLNTLYPKKLKPDLVVIDNLDRGFVLQVTDSLPPSQRVLVTSDIRPYVTASALISYHRVLYLPMESSVYRKKPAVVSSAVLDGWRVKNLPVIHAGLYEAVLFERNRTSMAVGQ